MQPLHVRIERSSDRQQSFTMQIPEQSTVLEMLEILYRHYDPTLSFRFACRTGLCATCTMMINGKPGLSCMKPAEPASDGILYLAPLPGNDATDLIRIIE